MSGFLLLMQVEAQSIADVNDDAADDAVMADPGVAAVSSSVLPMAEFDGDSYELRLAAERAMGEDRVPDYLMRAVVAYGRGEQ